MAENPRARRSLATLVVGFALLIVGAACSSTDEGQSLDPSITETSEVAEPSRETRLRATVDGISIDGTLLPAGETRTVELGQQITLDDGAHGLLTIGDRYELELLLGSSIHLVSVEPLQIVAELEKGHVLAKTRGAASPQFRLQTPDAIITTLEDEIELVACHAPGILTCVDVTTGSVEWESGGESKTVEAGRSAFAEIGDPPGDDVCVPDEEFGIWLDTARREGVGDLGALVTRFMETGCAQDTGGIGQYAGAKIPTGVGMVSLSADEPEIGTDDPGDDHYRARATLDEPVHVFLDEQAISNQQFRAWLVSAAGDEANRWRELAPDSWIRDAPAGAVTQATYAAGADDEPVVGIRPMAAEGYCGFTDKRLPTEIEWELAAVSGLLQDVGEIQEWVSGWDEYGPGVEEPARVLRGATDLLEPDLYYRFILVDEAEHTVARARAGFRCAADEVRDPPSATPVSGEIVYSDDFCSFDKDWPLVVGDGFDIGYHLPCFYHLESSEQHGTVAVVTGSDSMVPITIETDVLIRNTAESNGNFRYGLMTGSAGAGYLVFTVQPAREGDRFFLDWCVQPSVDALVEALERSGERYAGYTPAEGSPDRHAGESCSDGLASGRAEVESLENTLTMRAGDDAVTLAIDGEDVGEAPVPMPTGDVGMLVQTYHMPLAHLHFDKLVVTAG